MPKKSKRNDLATDLRAQLKPSHLVRLRRLPSADVAFFGNGPDDGTGPEPVYVGIEFKRLGEMLDSIQSGRFAGNQLPGLMDDYNSRILLLEDDIRVSSAGHLEVLKPFKQRNGKYKYGWTDRVQGPTSRVWMYRDIMNWIRTITIKGNVRFVNTKSRNETVHWILSEYWWWNSKEWEEHRSHIQIYDMHQTPLSRRAGFLTNVPRTAKIATQIPGLGQEKALAAAETFHNPWDFIHASAEELMEVPGIGETLANKIVEFWHGRS